MPSRRGGRPGRAGAPGWAGLGGRPARTPEEAVVGPQAEPAVPHVEGVHDGRQQLVVLQAPRQHVQGERLLPGAQRLEEKQAGGAAGDAGEGGGLPRGRRTGLLETRARARRGQAPAECWGEAHQRGAVRNGDQRARPEESAPQALLGHDSGRDQDRNKDGKGRSGPQHQCGVIPRREVPGELPESRVEGTRPGAGGGD